MLRKLLWVLVVLICASSIGAQTASVTPYAWDAGDLTLVYPVTWDVPLPSEVEDVQVLHLAQTLVGAPDTRPPSIPFITLTLYPTAQADTYGRLSEAVTALGVTPSGKTKLQWLDSDAVMTDGFSPDGLFYGFGQEVILPDERTLLIVGRSLAEQRDSFLAQFDMVADSLVLGAAAAPNLPGYGVLWYTERGLADGDEAFLDIIAMSLTSDALYILDSDLGVVRLNPQTGSVEAQFPFGGDWLSSDMAIGVDGRILVTDIACSCIHVLKDSVWTFGLGGFGDDAPRSIAAAPDGAIYVTDIDTNAVSVRVVDANGIRVIPFGTEVASQPRLLLDRGGRLLALTDVGQVQYLENEAFTTAFELGVTLPLIADATVDSSNQLVVLTENQGLFAFDAAGQPIEDFGRVVGESPRPGEFVSPRALAISANNTIFVADSDGNFGRITALSTLVESGRIGATELIPNLVVQGRLDSANPQQIWTFEGLKGEQVTLSALDHEQTGQLNLALRLINPEGEEEAYNDDQEGDSLPNVTDAQISNHTLLRDGRYSVVAERLSGEGSYQLGLSQAQNVELAAQVPLRAELQVVFPLQSWTFEGRAGQVVTITMTATSGDLDPVLRLLDGHGVVIAENDDADDTNLGPNAQLFEARLPVSGTYTVEADRFRGLGRYQLEIALKPQ